VANIKLLICTALVAGENCHEGAKTQRKKSVVLGLCGK